MNTYLKIFTICMLAVLVVPLALPVCACANSAPRYYEGTTEGGVTFVGEGCPLTVQSETLTFDIKKGADVGNDDDWFGIEASFCAEYTFVNPTEYDMHAQLAFPVENFYYYEKNTAERYKVTVDGAEVPAALRYTYRSSQGEFDCQKELATMLDTKIDDSRFKLDTVLYRQKYVLEGANAKNSRQSVAVRFPLDGKSTVFCDSVSSYKSDGADNVTLGVWLENGQSFDIYYVGKDGPDLSGVAQIYDNMGEKAETVQGQLTRVREADEQITFQSFVEENRPKDEISEVDWYNAVVKSLQNDDDRVLEYPRFNNLSRHLRAWYVYDMDVAAGQTVANAVSADMYPTVDLRYDPYVYRFDYLWSPAKQWASFNDLTVRINTDMYLIDSPSAFTQSDNGRGYTAHFDKLPDGELSFELCAEQNPEYKSGFGDAIVVILVVVGIGALVMFVLAVGATLGFGFLAAHLMGKKEKYDGKEQK